MTVVALIFAGISSTLHILFFVMESLTWRQPKTWRTFGIASQADADTTAPLAYNQGFYNLFLAVGAATGIVVIALSDVHDVVGWTLIVFACASMVGAAAVLLSTGRSYARAASIQGGPALLAVVASLIAST